MSDLLSHGPTKAFLVADLCKATERNGNSINADVTDDTINNLMEIYFWEHDPGSAKTIITYNRIQTQC
jgi:hypothetical protein